MQNLDLTQKSCISCSFDMFCFPGRGDKPFIKPASFLVKKRHYLARKKVLTLASGPFTSLFVVESGALKTNQIDINGNELIRGFYFAGEVFGFEAIYTKQYQYLPIALTDSVVCEIPYDQFLRFLHKNEDPELQKYILYLFSQQLSSGYYLTSTTAEQRVASFLLDLSRRISSKNTFQFKLPMTRYDMGSYLNLTAETVSRTLSKMHIDKLISINYKMISILDAAKIESMLGHI